MSMPFIFLKIFNRPMLLIFTKPWRTRHFDTWPFSQFMLMRQMPAIVPKKQDVNPRSNLVNIINPDHVSIMQKR
jgi:hypothetical protein